MELVKAGCSPAGRPRCVATLRRQQQAATLPRTAALSEARKCASPLTLRALDNSAHAGLPRSCPLQRLLLFRTSHPSTGINPTPPRPG